MYQISSFDESWGEHRLQQQRSLPGLPLADVKGVVAMTAQILVDRAIEDGVRNLVVQPLPRHSYVDGFTIEYQKQGDDAFFSFVVVAEEVKVA